MDCLDLFTRRIKKEAGSKVGKSGTIDFCLSIAESNEKVDRHFRNILSRKES